MSDTCARLHRFVHALPRHRYPFDSNSIHKNGVYILFEQGETGHDGDRIVRVGTHTGEDRLPSRLSEHFDKENKDRSIFRKNIGRALLNRNNDPFLKQWNKDLTSKVARQRASSIVKDRQSEVERKVSEYLRTQFSFVVFLAGDKNGRLSLEGKLIATVFQCEECRHSANWLGLSSPKAKIRESGLWLVAKLDEEPLLAADFDILERQVQT